MLKKIQDMLRINNEKGMVLVLVMGFITMMVLSAMTLSSMIQRDVRLIQSVNTRAKVRYVAEAGLNHAFAKLLQDGFASFTNFSDSIDTGSYSVTKTDIGGRSLIESVGTISGVSITSSAEIVDTTATALKYFSGAGNDINFKIHTNVNGAITGDIHANGKVSIVVQPNASIVIDGDVSATSIVTEGVVHDQADNKDTDLWINGVNNDSATVYENVARITFPEFDYAQYKQDAIDSGDGSYYSSDQVFSSQTLSPANGIIYIDGDARFDGDCVLNGGIVADSINITGTLTQVKAGSKNVILAKERDVEISGRLVAEEALVCAERDINTHEKWGATVTVNGCMLAKRDIRMWNTRTALDYDHVYMTPEAMTEGGLEVISWNR